MATPFTYSTIGFSGYSGYSGAFAGTGTSGYYAKFTGVNSLSGGLIQDNGSTVTITGNLSATGTIIGGVTTSKSAGLSWFFGY